MTYLLIASIILNGYLAIRCMGQHLVIKDYEREYKKITERTEAVEAKMEELAKTTKLQAYNEVSEYMKKLKP
jgi:hypothetical protein